MMRERLIELLTETETYTDGFGSYTRRNVEYKADHLLANGVIVPPCKVGTTLYFLYDNAWATNPDHTSKIYVTTDWYFDIDPKGISILPRSIRGYKGKYHYYLNETVFLTREQAEQALAERSEQG